MNFDPQKFFIGLLDFFSILLPGALLTYLLRDELGPGRAGGSLFRAPRTRSLGSLPVRELSLGPPGLPARLLAGRVLRLGQALHAEYADHIARPPRSPVALACPHAGLAGIQARAGPRARTGD